MTIRNRELSQFGSFIYIDNHTKDIGITTAPTPYVGIGTTNATSKFHVVGETKLEGDVNISGITTLASSGGITTTGGDLFVGGNIYATELVGNVTGIASTAIFATTAFTLNGVSESNLNVAFAQTSGISSESTKLETLRDFSITGDFVTASAVSFDGTGNVGLSATITENSIALGTYTSGDYVESITGTTSEIVVTSGTGEGSTPTIGLSSNLVLPGNLQISGFTTFSGITTFSNEVFSQSLNSGIVSSTAYYLNGSLLVDPGLETWAPATLDSATSIYREQGNVGIGTSTGLYKLSVNGQIQSQAPQGTSPFVVNSTTTVPNLSADFLAGKSAPFGDIVGTNDTQTLSNKTLETPIITSINNSGTQTIPTGNGTLVSTNSVGVITSGMIASGAVSNSQLENSTISGVSLGSTLFSLDRGNYITYSTGTSYDGSVNITIGVAGTTANTGNTLVARNSSGDFTAGTATLFGVTLNGGSISGNGSVNINGNITAGAGYTFYGDGSGITGVTADAAVKVSAADTSTAGPFYLTFVDSNNTPAEYETLFTDGGITYDALNGRLGIGSAQPTSKLSVVGDGNFTGVVTASGGFNIGIQSGGVNITTDVITAINFVGFGNSISYDPGTKTIDVSISGGGGGGELDITSSLFV